ncbi:IspD/TarI family cytidylyltransferase [Spirochaetia bacterium 38H-sp]|uniref:IspD/TarI family cytidylyltransferase n=1 Tax=Rarispira pelagica TaxID=3141764 RepID=A0ABU9UAN5_9SPIR
MKTRKMTKINAFIITAAGNSTRMGTGDKKEYRLLNKKPVIFFSIEAALKTNLFSVIAVSLPHADLSEWQEKIMSKYADSNCCFVFVSGGKTRQESVKNALIGIENHAPDFVLIHDGARPWVTPELIESVLKKTSATGACVPIIPSVDAVKRILDDGKVIEHLSKYEYVSAQTPQGFSYPLIKKAHLEYVNSDRLFFDDAEMVAAMGKDVFFVKGDARNRKITFGWDL